MSKLLRLNHIFKYLLPAAENVQVVQLTGISKSTLIRKRKRRNI